MVSLYTTVAVTDNAPMRRPEVSTIFGCTYVQGQTGSDTCTCAREETCSPLRAMPAHAHSHTHAQRTGARTHTRTDAHAQSACVYVYVYVYVCVCVRARVYSIRMSV